MGSRANTPRVLLLHHKEKKWPKYLVEYSDLKLLSRQKALTIEIASLPQQNAHLDYARLSDSVRRLLFFAKPDVLACYDDGVKPLIPIFAIDVTEHVAARDHWIQRFPNLVGCAQEGVPGAFVAPRDMPNRPKFSGKTDPVFFYAYDRVIEIHQTPIYIAEWQSTDGQHLDRDSKFTELPKHDSSDMRRVLQFFNMVLDAARRGADLNNLMRERLIVDLRDQLRRVGYSSLPNIGDFDRLKYNMPSNDFLTQADLTRWLHGKGLNLPNDTPDRIKKRDRTVIFTPMSGTATDDEKREALLKRIKLRGGDPYTQQPLVFDYLFCRLGPHTSERDANLVLDLTVLAFADFAEYVASAWRCSPLQYTRFSDIKSQIPMYTLHLGSGLGQVMKNFVRLYSFAADLIVFSDGVLYF